MVESARVRIATDGPNGSFVAVNHDNGKNAVFVSSMEEDGLVLIKSRNGKVRAAFPKPGEV